MEDVLRMEAQHALHSQSWVGRGTSAATNSPQQVVRRRRCL